MTRHLALSNHGLRNGGGIERYAMTLVGGLHARGERPTVIAKFFDTGLPEYGWVNPVRVSVAWVPGKLRDLYLDYRIGRIKRRLGLYPLIACNQTRWADIGICGGTHLGFLEAMDQAAGISDRWKIELERAHLQAAQVVVAHSRRMHDEAVRHYGIAPQKIRLLYPPVDGSRFTVVSHAERMALRQRLGFTADRAVFLLASTGHARKSLHLLAQYFGRTERPVTLVVAGRPADGGLRNVRSLGYRRDIADVYRAADFTVMASHYEPFGLVGIESVLCGTPVVVAHNVGCAEVLRAPAAVGFALDDPASLDAAVASAVDRWRADRHRLGEPARHIAYDTRVATHVEALLGLVAELRRPG